MPRNERPTPAKESKADAGHKRLGDEESTAESAKRARPADEPRLGLAVVNQIIEASPLIVRREALGSIEARTGFARGVMPCASMEPVVMVAASRPNRVLFSSRSDHRDVSSIPISKLSSPPRRVLNDANSPRKAAKHADDLSHRQDHGDLAEQQTTSQ